MKLQPEIMIMLLKHVMIIVMRKFMIKEMTMTIKDGGWNWNVVSTSTAVIFSFIISNLKHSIDN